MILCLEEVELLLYPITVFGYGEFERLRRLRRALEREREKEKNRVSKVKSCLRKFMDMNLAGEEYGR